ncbi:cellulose binding domain-containing protein [Agarivorans sp. 1_MG-2023]|uniref:cellulose binding domain-containing protein n=1 Tax=Agarivorans sp. 1_MG-2023 TaxID=3062634 RepID=UPI0026E23F53|nr:cellulose binding domain-containing protein [Agarivorans sp. 1_MG-2023]MDO6762461.1 cellulose binding domain-containing protein [Agarivorans sp. 1_MG-2023]
MSPEGNDANSGTLQSPLKTLKGARDKVRAEKDGSPSTLHFRAGTYPITEQVTFSAADSGSSAAPVTYRSYSGETAFFDGLAKINASKFQLVEGSLRSRLHSTGAGKIWSQVISDQSLINLLKEPGAGLSFNTQPLITTRSPNIGFFNVSTISSLGTGNGTHDAPLGDRFRMHEEIDYDKFRIELERNGRQAYIDGYLSADWFREQIPVQRFGSTGSRLFVMVNKARYTLKGATTAPRFRIKNMLATLDVEREWFFDKTDNRLYIFPPNGTMSSNDTIGVWAGPQAIYVNGANHLSFEKIVFQHFGKGNSEDGVITVNQGDNIKIAGCTFRYTALPLAPVNLRDRATNSSLISSDLYDNGRGSRLRGGSYNASGITHGRNRFENNHFSQVNLPDGRGDVVGIAGAGQVFKHNLVHNSNAQPITFSGVDHTLEYNEIFNVGNEEGDGGATYTGANIFSFGNKLQYNFVHHLITTPGLVERAGFFSDDYDAGEQYLYNTMYKAGSQSIKMNMGSGHTVQYNYLMDTRKAVDLLGRDATFQKAYNTSVAFLKDNPNSTSKSNYLGRAEKVLGDFVNNQTATYNLSWDNSYWANRYPYLKTMLRDSRAKLGMFPTEIRIYDNLFSNTDINFQHSPGYGTERGSISLDTSHFVDPGSLNFELKSSKPNSYPDNRFKQIGLKTDAYRSTTPNKNSYRKAVKNRWQNSASWGTGSYDRSTFNGRAYYNSGKLIVPTSQQGLGVRESDASGSSSPQQDAYVSQSIPGRIQAQHYDLGGNNTGYFDTTANNNGNVFRSDDVDIQSTTDTSGSYNLGWVANGEWLDYTFADVKTGVYNINIRVAANGTAAHSIQLQLNGNNLGTANFSGTGGWQNWTTETLEDVTIQDASSNSLRANILSGGFNLNWIEFVEASTTTPNPDPSPDPEPDPEPTSNCSYSINQDYSSGFSADITITNTGNSAINSWEIQWQLNDGSTVSNSWNAEFSGNNPYTAKNLPWNGNIAANGSVVIGVQIDKGSSNAKAEIVNLGGTVCN